MNLKNIIYYYSGTGNSLWVARLLAAELGETKLISMAHMEEQHLASETEVVGMVFPVHIWGVPKMVLDTLKKLDQDPNRYFFAAAVNAGQVSRTLLQLKACLRSCGIKLSAGFDFVLPSNYIPWGGPGPIEEQRERFVQAKEKAISVSKIIARRESAPIEKGPLWQRVIFTLIYNLSFNSIAKSDRNFWADEKCNSCNICAQICPVKNVEIKEGKPAWQNHCEQCLACLQWCPKKAIQYGKKTGNYERYHNPEIKINDMLLDKI